MLNFDMIASPNFARFVYDGSDPDAPAGSGAIEDLFNDYFEGRGLAFEPTPFDGRSDYGPFIAADIPAGGLFTGAEDIKTDEQEDLFGGTAGLAFDPCYHKACDTIGNVNDTALRQMSDAAAAATMTFAQNTQTINGEEGKGNFKPRVDRHGSRPVGNRGGAAAAPPLRGYRRPRSGTRLVADPVFKTGRRMQPMRR
jgi:hypothetical protein